jgi:aminopeptidase N
MPHLRTATTVLLAMAILPLAAPAQTRDVLPAMVIPDRYDIHLSPDAAALTYQGEETVTLEVSKATGFITLNAKVLKVDAATIDGLPAQTISADAAREQVTFSFATPVAKGRHELHVTWHGSIPDNRTLGLFAMDYDSPDGTKRTLATNLEPAELRTFVPSWDQPDMKAVFSLTLDAPSGQMAIANMPVAETKPLGNGFNRVRFADTPRMSTYLFFFTIGDYERIHQDVAGVDLGVVVKRGDAAKGRYALEQAARLLPYYNDYFGVPFPLPKLDLIAAPGNIVGGSMENWGANFYGQEHLLFDPASSTEADRQLVFLVVAHEMSHQWFGDLVTMQWWDNLWLNEGFARWMQTYAADALHPEWRTGLKALDIYEEGKTVDAKPGTHPVLQRVDSATQAAQAFDSITYEKGAAVINMLIAYAGADALRDGIRAYIKAHAYSNTVDSDLWSEVQKAAGRKLVRVEQDFTQKAGLPLIRVTQTARGSHISVDRFVVDPSQPQPQPQPVPAWHLPVEVSAGKGRVTLLLDGQANLDERTPLVNAAGKAYARVLYDAATFAAITTEFAHLDAADQYNLLNDASALGNSGYAPASRLLDLLQVLPKDADPLVWSRALDLVTGLDHIYSPSPQRTAFRAWAQRLFKPVAARLGDTATAGEDASATSLRSDLFEALAHFGDAAALGRAKTLRASGRGSPDEQRAALGIVARQADAATFDALLAEAHAETDPLLRKKILLALGQVDDPILGARFINEVALSRDAPAGSAASLIRAALSANPDTGWAALAPHLDDPDLPIDPRTAYRAVPAYAAMSQDLKRIDDLVAYAGKHIPADARQAVDDAVAQIRLNARIHAHALPDIEAWIAGK